MTQLDVERREAFGAFTRTFLERAYRLAGMILRDRPAAEDAVQREGTIKSRLHYALRQMRSAIEATERTTGDSR